MCVTISLLSREKGKETCQGGKRKGDMLRSKEGRAARMGGGSTAWCDMLHMHHCHFNVIANELSREGGKEGACQGEKRQG